MSADAYDTLQLAGELCQRALRSPRGAEQYAVTREAAAALAASLAAQERSMLARWQAIGRDEIDILEVAPSADMRDDLAADMFALGWYVPSGSGKFCKPPTPTAALSRADWQGITRAMVERKTADLERQVAEVRENGREVKGDL